MAGFEASSVSWETAEKTGRQQILSFPQWGYHSGQALDKTSLGELKCPLSASSHEKSLWHRWQANGHKEVAEFSSFPTGV